MRTSWIVAGFALLAGAAPAPAQTGGVESDTPAATAPEEPDCGWTPTVPELTNEHMALPQNAGCGLAPASEEPWRGVTTLRIVQVDLDRRRTGVGVVLLDAQNRRVLPYGRVLRYELALDKTRKGQVELQATQQKDGVFLLELPGGAKPEPCELMIKVQFDAGGEEPLEDWVDDWEHLC